MNPLFYELWHADVDSLSPSVAYNRLEELEQKGFVIKTMPIDKIDEMMDSMNPENRFIDKDLLEVEVDNLYVPRVRVKD